MNINILKICLLHIYKMFLHMGMYTDIFIKNSYCRKISPCNYRSVYMSQKMK